MTHTIARSVFDGLPRPPVEPLEQLCRYALVFTALSGEWWPLGKVSIRLARDLRGLVTAEAARLGVDIQTRIHHGVLEIRALN